MLLKNGKRAKLIQSLDGFRLMNLVEIRVFLNAIKKDLHTPVIPDDIWEKAKNELNKRYYLSSAFNS